MSSSVYRTSSSPSRSSRSPTPSTPTTTVTNVRRSGRSRKAPVTYELKALFGLDKESNDTPNHSERETSSPASDAPQRATLHEFSVASQTERGPWHNTNISKLLWTRALRGARSSHDDIRATVSSNLKLSKWWKGASNDVSALAWSPDGTKFAAGATTQPDEYNRKNNLVFGDLLQNTLHELPDHNIPRKSNIADERLFATLSAIQWVGQRLYTSSYDHTVKIWDTDTTPFCVRTLKHDSKVRVMAVSNLMPNLLATGTEQAFSLWRNPDKDGQEPESLKIYRDPRQKANIVLEPTVLAWGPNAATEHYLAGGMGERGGDEFKVSLCGQLSMWRVTESSIERRKVRPDSQNIFDLKWHPSMRRFATASTYSQSMGLPLRTRSVVQIYDILSDDKFKVTSQFACSALDMNDVTFCPMDTTYITASCTDGSTYVWDNRNPARAVHRLRHGTSVNPLNPDYSREATDFGVRVALWGTTIDQFYTGGSDGCLKQWDIRRSTEDALVANITCLDEGIMSGAFSQDKSQLLLGDFAGGIHVLSCEQSSDPEPLDFRPAPEPSSAEEPAVPLANELLSTGQLTLHPIFGPVQGPCYKGPYAPWARGLPKDATQVQHVPLLSQYQLRQFDGPSLEDRHELDQDSRQELQCHLNLARARHARHTQSGAAPQSSENDRKRRRDDRTSNSDGGEDNDPIILDSDQGPSFSPAQKKTDNPKRKVKSMDLKDREKKKKKKKKNKSHVITRVENAIIDLTVDSDRESQPASSSPAPHQQGPPLLATLKGLKEESEDEDEDYWWPDSRQVDANLSHDEVF
ncbi:uncharacterized protein N7482_002344 [Penicillium canariense]|uniref:WD40 repeat-like protein n=1 Tax=Penicillium canariense TaxID=189055 RepID=A0A9W9IHE4_9EURO|nr:uncharacterized protein N7482_002344 [Penicillium canariense]KAJ5176467.1 hypothetical protein N7482_002344 [Penicillium canariense]